MLCYLVPVLGLALLAAVSDEMTRRAPDQRPLVLRLSPVVVVTVDTLQMQFS